jgi:hypothetical protein
VFSDKSINSFARTISSQPMGLAYHRPEKWAHAFHCFANVIKKVQQDGGNARFGWTFSCRIMSDAPDLGYLIATHHAVWHAPDGRLVDVTPFHTDAKHHPYAPTGDVLFLVDDKAKPVVVGKNALAPLPLKFFPLSNDDRLIAHIEEIRDKEEQQCKDIYQGKLGGVEKTLF